MAQHVTPPPSRPSRNVPRLPAIRSPWRLDTFAALRHGNYRLYFWGQLVSLTGSWLQNAALTWLAWHLTHQSSWPALIAAVQVLPTFVLGAWGGSLADRWPKRPLIFGCQLALLLLAVLLGVLVIADAITPWRLLLVAAACGVVNAIDLPARLAFVIEMVGREDLINAIALNSLLFNTARAVGPAASAVLLPSLGAGLCFLLNGLSFAAVLVALACMKLPPWSGPPARGRSSLSLWAGFRYLAGHRKLVLLLLLSGCLTLFGWPMLSLLPAVSARQLDTGANGYAWMLSGVGCGALLAALLVATFGPHLRRGWFLAAGISLSSAALLLLSAAHHLPLAVLASALHGCGLILFFANSQAIMQLGSTDANRGRIMGIWSMVLSGAHPAGHLLAGWAADVRDVSWVLAVLGLGIAASAALVLPLALLPQRKALLRTTVTMVPEERALPKDAAGRIMQESPAVGMIKKERTNNARE